MCSRTTTPTILASQIAQFSQMYPGRYEFGALRGHGWIPAKAGISVAREPRPLRGVARHPLQGPRGGAVLLRRTVLQDRRRPHRAEADERLPGVRRRHERQDVRARSGARLGDRRAAAAAVRGVEGSARPLPVEVRRARHDARHRLDPRLLSRRRSRHGTPRGRGGNEELPCGQRLSAHGRRQAAAGGGDERGRATASISPASSSSSPPRRTTR